MRTSFHHQPEAQHPKSPAIYTPAGRLPHLWSGRIPAALRREILQPELTRHEVRHLSARPHPAVWRRLPQSYLELFQEIALEDGRMRPVVAAQVAERRFAQRVVPRQQFLNPARHETRHRLSL